MYGLVGILEYTSPIALNIFSKKLALLINFAKTDILRK